jgi:hypothetical protein
VIMLGNFGRLSLNLLVNLQRAHESQSWAIIKPQLDKYGREQVNQTVLAAPLSFTSRTAGSVVAKSDKRLLGGCFASRTSTEFRSGGVKAIFDT